MIPPGVCEIFPNNIEDWDAASQHEASSKGFRPGTMGWILSEFSLYTFSICDFTRYLYQQEYVSKTQFDKKNIISLHNLFYPIVSVLLCSAIHIALRIGTKEILWKSINPQSTGKVWQYHSEISN